MPLLRVLVDALSHLARELHPLFEVTNAVPEVLLYDFSERLYMLKIDVFNEAAQFTFLKLNCLDCLEVLV